MDRDVLKVQHRQQPRCHDDGIDEQCETESQILTQQELEPSNRLGDNGVDGFLFDLLADQADADENRDQHSIEIDTPQPNIQDQPMKLPERQSHQYQRAADHQEGKDQEVVEQLISKILAKGVECDRKDLHETRASTGCWAPVALRINRSSSEALCGVSATSFALADCITSSARSTACWLDSTTMTRSP